MNPPSMNYYLKSNNTAIYHLCLLCLFAALAACTEARHYEKNYDIVDTKWAADSLYVFEFEIKDATAKYDFFYNLRNDLLYPYQNIYVAFYLENAQKEVIDQELQNITLFDPKTGKPFGSGFGDTYSHQLPIPKLTNFKFPKAGKYTYRLEQRMREDPLPKIRSVGLKIVKVP